MFCLIHWFILRHTLKFCVAFHYKPQHVTHILHHLSCNGAHCSLVVLQLDLNTLCPPGELTHGKLGSLVTAEGKMTHARAVRCERGTSHTTLLAAAGLHIAVCCSEQPLVLWAYCWSKVLRGREKMLHLFPSTCVHSAKATASEWEKAECSLGSLHAAGVKAVACAEQQFCFPVYSLGTLSWLHVLD